MRLTNAKRLLTAGAMLALAAQAQAAQARIGFICPELNPATGELTVKVDSGCVSSSASLISNDLELAVDQEIAAINVTGEMEFGGGPIQTADCMGRQQITLSASDIEQRRYSLIYQGEYVATFDMIEQPQSQKCVGPRSRNYAEGEIKLRSSLKDWNDNPISGWQDWRGDSVFDVLSLILNSHPESMEGRATADIKVEKQRWRREAVGPLVPHSSDPFFAVTITQHGYLDDSVSGGRYFADVRQDEDGQWMVAGLWRQNMCARGKDAGQWTRERCP